MNRELRIKIASELVKIAAEVSGVEEFDKIDGMGIGQLIDYIKQNKTNYTSMSSSLKMNKFKKFIDMSQPLRGTTVKELLQMIAKLGVDMEDEEE